MVMAANTATDSALATSSSELLEPDLVVEKYYFFIF
jgi:hypothetical protein